MKLGICGNYFYETRVGSFLTHSITTKVENLKELDFFPEYLNSVFGMNQAPMRKKSITPTDSGMDLDTYRKKSLSSFLAKFNFVNQPLSDLTVWQNHADYLPAIWALGANVIKPKYWHLVLRR